jgi:hypothetical protein
VTALPDAEAPVMPAVLAPQPTALASAPLGLSLVVNDGGVRLPAVEPVKRSARIVAKPAPAPVRPVAVPVYAPKQDRN